MKYARFLPGWLPTDENFIKFYGDNVNDLMFEFGHSFWSAVALAREYYEKVITTQNQELVWRNIRNLADEIHYRLVVRGDPIRFIDWRTERNRLKRLSRLKTT